MIHLPPVPRFAACFRIWGIQFVLRPGALILYGTIAVVFDAILLPHIVPGLASMTYHATAVMMAFLVALITLLHEYGHALAYRLQGTQPVRVTLRGSGGACAAIVSPDDTALRSLARALAGPAVSGACIIGLVTLMHLPTASPIVRVAVLLVALFAFFDLVCNLLPLHPRCDGTFALSAVLWLLRARPAEQFTVLYVWRPLVMASVIICGPFLTLTFHAGYPAVMVLTIAALFVLILCAVALIATIRSSGIMGRIRPSAT